MKSFELFMGTFLYIFFFFHLEHHYLSLQRQSSRFLQLFIRVITRMSVNFHRLKICENKHKCVEGLKRENSRLTRRFDCYEARDTK